MKFFSVLFLVTVEMKAVSVAATGFVVCGLDNRECACLGGNCDMSSCTEGCSCAGIGGCDMSSCTTRCVCSGGNCHMPKARSLSFCSTGCTLGCSETECPCLSGCTHDASVDSPPPPTPSPPAGSPVFPNVMVCNPFLSGIEECSCVSGGCDMTQCTRRCACPAGNCRMSADCIDCSCGTGCTTTSVLTAAAPLEPVGSTRRDRQLLGPWICMIVRYIESDSPEGTDSMMISIRDDAVNATCDDDADCFMGVYDATSCDRSVLESSALLGVNMTEDNATRSLLNYIGNWYCEFTYETTPEGGVVEEFSSNPPDFITGLNDLVGKAAVLHDSEGDPVECGIIELTTNTAPPPSPPPNSDPFSTPMICNPLFGGTRDCNCPLGGCDMTDCTFRCSCPSGNCLIGADCTECPCPGCTVAGDPPSGSPPPPPSPAFSNAMTCNPNLDGTEECYCLQGGCDMTACTHRCTCPPGFCLMNADCTECSCGPGCTTGPSSSPSSAFQQQYKLASFVVVGILSLLMLNIDLK